MHDQNRRVDRRNAVGGAELIVHQEADRHDGIALARNVGCRRERRIEDDCSHLHLCREGDGDACAEGFAIEHDSVRRSVLTGEGVGRPRVLGEARLGR